MISPHACSGLSKTEERSLPCHERSVCDVLNEANLARKGSPEQPRNSHHHGGTSEKSRSRVDITCRNTLQLK
jgi:hypothetical protein